MNSNLTTRDEGIHNNPQGTLTSLDTYPQSVMSKSSATKVKPSTRTARDPDFNNGAMYTSKPQPDSGHAYHAPAALSPKTMYDVTFPTISTLSLNGSPVIDDPRKDPTGLPFHLCNPIEVQDHILASLTEMFATNWPSPTPVAIKQDPQFCKIYNLVKAKNLPNALGARVIIPSGLNLAAWINVLQEYHDNQICHFLAFGWPIGYYSSSIPKSVEANHPSATAHPDHVETFIQTEKEHHAIAGPFDAPPFAPWTRLSPLMSRPKKGSTERRIIVDLSFPQGEAVNSAIDITSYLGKDITYSLPSITDLITKLQLEGPGAYIWKADLARAYRQLRADPIDAPLLGIQFVGKVFIDLCPPFGCRSSSAACQRVANSLVFVLRKMNHYCLAYLDDFAGCAASYNTAKEGYDCFTHLTQLLGLQLSHKKCVKPTTNIEWLGYQVNTRKMSVSIPAPKLEEVLKECEAWESRSRVNKVMIQSLLGKLVHLSNCIQHGRKFLARILAALRAMENRNWTTIDDEFKKDVRWFQLYARTGNGINLYTPSLPALWIECDSSLLGGGGNTTTHAYSWVYKENHTETFKAIHQLEAVNILIAYRTLAHLTSKEPTAVTIYTDNMSSSCALMTGHTRDTVLASCARELWLEAAKFGDRITIEHKPGQLIPMADALSRMAHDPAKANYVRDYLKNHHLTLVPPATDDCNFFDDNL